MKYTFFLVLLFLFSGASLLAQDKNKTDNQGRKQGYWEKVDKNGKLKYKGQFENDVPYGKFKYYDSDGAITLILEFISADTAIATHYHSNSKKAAYGYYVHQKKEGVWRFYDKKGVLASSEEFKNGVKHGKYTVYNLNGTVSRETYYVDGMENGYRKTFDANGKILTEGNIKDGQMDGEQITYRAGVINIRGSYKHAVRDGQWTYYDADGKVYKVELYELGIKKN